MDQAPHNTVVSLTCCIADDVLRDFFKRGTYPDVILPICVIRRMDAVRESTKQAALNTEKKLDDAQIITRRAALCDAAGQAFYNTSGFTPQSLRTLADICADILVFEQEAGGLIDEIIGSAQ